MKSMTDIRTRFAPSPTGFLHVGGVRTALFAWMIARQNDGAFILRIEDTDQKRLETGSMAHIQESLQWLNILWDEGPDKPGPYGPYQQSERLDTYRQWAEKLIAQGRAYADPYTAEEVQAFREQAQKEKRPFLYRNHRPDQPPVWNGTTPLRFKSEPKAYDWHDEVMGDLASGPEVIDDFILMKSDGYPTYNFAHIVDDAEMKITHVIRGQEFLSSTPNYLNLYEALGFDMTAKQERTRDLQGVEQDSELTSESQRRGKPLLPVFATMPHIMNEQGNKKLSKRDGAKDILDYRAEGYLPEAMRNFLASLGWNDGTEQEVFSTDELIQKFSLNRVQKSGARFDERRLVWLNGQHIRLLSLDELARRVAPFWPESAAEADEDYKMRVLALVQDRLKFLADLSALSRYFFEEPVADMTLITGSKPLAKLEKKELAELLQAAYDGLDSLSDWQSQPIQDRLNELLESTAQKPAVLFSLIRITVTWAPFSPQLNDSLELLGRDRSLARIKQALDLLR